MKCLSAAELGPRSKRADDWGHRAASESTEGDLNSSRTKEHSFSLTAFMRMFEAARGEAARAYRRAIGRGVGVCWT